MKKTIKAVIIISLLFSACAKDGEDGYNSLIDIENESVGENCSSGGIKVKSGLDRNRNGVLDDNEVAQTKYVCNGKDGSSFNSLIDVLEEPAGINCEYGGHKIISGLDLDSNNVLDSNEVLNIEYICSAYLGSTQTGFSIDTIYKAETDGFLNVRIFTRSGGGGGSGGTYIYSDDTNDPTTLVGSVSTKNSSTLVPIHKGDYWKVLIPLNGRAGGNNDIEASISWIPIEK